MCQHRHMRNRLVAAVVIAVSGVSIAACGDAPKQATPADRAALDRFASAVRDWRREGTEPWNRALAAGKAKLAVASPTVESAMRKAIGEMDAAAADVSDPKVRSALERLVATYRAKLAAVHKVDSAGYSLATLKQGLTDLKAAGADTLQAWNGYVRQAKAAWNSNPLAGLNVG